jgi:hypothetical protein
LKSYPPIGIAIFSVKFLKENYYKINYLLKTFRSKEARQSTMDKGSKPK